MLSRGSSAAIWYLSEGVSAMIDSSSRAIRSKSKGTDETTPSNSFSLFSKYEYSRLAYTSASLAMSCIFALRKSFS